MSILVISIDDLAAFAFLKSLYGGNVHTPNIDRLMAMGTTFQNGFSQVALCNPSRTSAMTGLTPPHTGVHQNAIEYWNAVSPQDLLMAHFMNAGYHTSVIGKVMHSTRVPDEYGTQFADFIFENRTDVGGNAIGVLPEGDRSLNGDEINVAEALALLASYSPGDAFAMFVGINKPHLNWVVPQEFYDLYPVDSIVMTDFPTGDLGDLPPSALALTGQDRWNIDPSLAGPEAMQAYLAAISYADFLLGQLLDQLADSGLSDSTTIVLWTDHGHHLGDKDQWGKFTLWDDAARAPFVIAQPGTEDDGQVVEQVVELVDLMPTLLELQGLPVPSGLDGRSLVPFIENPSLLDNGVAVTSMDGNVSIRTNEWRFTRYASGDIELYAADDPHNFDNLADDPAYADIVAQMSSLLYAEAAADGWVIGSGTGELHGTDAAEAFVPYLEHTIYGGGGNDLYHLVYGGFGFYPDIIELEGGGYDTIRTSALWFVMPDNIERVIGLEEAASLTGNDGDNVIMGGQYMWGGAGNDELYGRSGDDYMVGGTGDDLLHGGFGHDTVDYSDAGSAITMRWRIVTSVTEGRDTLRNVEQVIGSAFGDTMYGTIGADTLMGGDGADTLVGEEGDDLLYGGAAADEIFGSAGNDVMNGDLGDDSLRGGTGDDILFGGAGWDMLDGGGGNDLLDGGNGTDTASFLNSAVGVEVALWRSGAAQNTRAGLDTLVSIENLQGSNYSDLLVGDGIANRLAGKAGDDLLKGLGGNDLLLGDDGRDELVGGDGNDVLRGGAGNDALIGGIGFDFLFGDGGDDYLKGGNGTDRIFGGSGNDIADGGAQDDFLYGQQGDDFLIGGDGDDRLEGNLGADTLRGDGGHDALFGHEGNDLLFGGLGDDTLSGHGGDDQLHGGDGDDWLDGGSDKDTLAGGEGSDVLVGGWGRDTASGGAGADVFLFGEGHTGRVEQTADLITDFSRADGDVIDLSAIDANNATTSDDAFTFIGTAAFSGTAGELRFYYSTGGHTFLAGDTDGDGSADFFIELSGLHDLAASDFVM